MPLIDGGTQRLPRVIGIGRALDLILTGRPVEADEAQAMGLVDRVVAPGEHLERALELAEGLAAFPQETMLATAARRSRASGCRSPRGSRSRRGRPGDARAARGARPASPPARAGTAGPDNP